MVVPVATSFSTVDVSQNLPYLSAEEPTHLQNTHYKLAKEAYQYSYSIAGIFGGQNLTTGKANASNTHIR